jgi:hypothetical protein
LYNSIFNCSHSLTNKIDVWKGTIITLPAELPGTDRVQIYLNDMQQHEMKMYASAQHEDRADRLRAKERKAMAKYTELKEERTRAAAAMRVAARQEKQQKLQSMVAQATDSSGSNVPFQAQLKHKDGTARRARRRKQVMAGPPRPKGLKALKIAANKIIKKAAKEMSQIGPTVVNAVDQLKEHLKDIAEEQILDMVSVECCPCRFFVCVLLCTLPPPPTHLPTPDLPTSRHIHIPLTTSLSSPPLSLRVSLLLNHSHPR